MFNNYQELFHSFVDFYKSSFYDAEPSNQILTTAHQMTTASLLKTIEPDRCILLDNLQNDTTTITTTTATSDVANKCTPNHLELDTNQMMAMANNYQDQVLDDPRLLIEGDGSKLVRLGSFNSLDVGDLIHIASIFLILVMAKRWLTRKLANLKWLDKLGLREKDRERIDESVWRLLYYSFSSTWLIYCCLKHNSHLLLTNQPQPIAYSFQLDWPTYAILMIEAAFYLHATYALIFEDVWRRDSPMMLVHHLAAVFATLSLYATRTHHLGVASTVLRDTCDVLLEVTKLTKCFHIQHGKRVRSLGLLVNCFLSVFALIFAVNQLYYFPLFCLFHGLNMTKLYNIQTPTMIGILTCGLLFLLLDMLWFCLILRLLYYMALAKPMKDLREYDDEDEDLIESDVEADKATKAALSERQKVVHKED